ncbi:YggS family pyridoxal phosphate enzyme [Deinococcus pimensis]|uniref:YggS family pyridoxal phosphate enzyme n=1 Tax=Deinococcus pimensis TaxID=309888 RepID=UPI00048298BF|nr:YggS family pyridoxal phosphate enzyme [Deinococcus pimensis]
MSLEGVLAGLRAAERDAGLAPGSARLVAVTKGHPAAEVLERVLTRGDFPLGESRGQELRDKRAELETLAPGREVEWHFIGALQTNKLKYLRGVRLVHTLARADHARELARLASAWGAAPDLLIQVHNGEPQKSGVQPSEVERLYHEVSLMGLTVRGLMVMAPEGDPAGAERVFALTAALARDLGLPELSMGMSDDYPVAVRHGATLVRVGRALFL